MSPPPATPAESGARATVQRVGAWWQTGPAPERSKKEPPPREPAGASLRRFRRALSDAEVAAVLAGAAPTPAPARRGVADPELGQAPYLYAHSLSATLAGPTADGADALHVPGSPAHERMAALLDDLMAARRAIVMVDPTVSDADVRLTYEGGEAAEMTFRLAWRRMEAYDAADGTLLEVRPGPPYPVRFHATLRRTPDGTWRVATMSSGLI